MPDPVATELFGLPGPVLLWLLTLVSFFLFGRRVVAYVKILRKARGEKRWDDIGSRLKLFVVNVLAQGRLLRQPVIGVAHLLIFWAFVFYATGFFWNLLRGLIPVLPIPYADEAAWMSFCLAVFGVLGLLALAVAAVRRYIFPPPGLEKSGDATLILVLISLVLVSSLAGLYFHERDPSVAVGMWWLHMIVVLGFLAYLPYSKHLHLLASPFSVLFGELKPSGVPPVSEGAARRDQFTWRQLFSGLACAECGRCERVCPAFQSGLALSPKKLMHDFKELVRAGGNSHDGTAFVGGTVTHAEIWACLTCYACMQECPVFNEHIPPLVEMRRHLVSNGEMERQLQDVLTNLTRYGNSFGASPRTRAKWAQSLGFRVKDARKEPVEYLWFVGDYASFDPRAASSTCATARLLRHAGVDFGILHEAEQNAGTDARRVGEEGLFEMLMEKNLQAMGKARFRQIVTTDPHTYQALKNEYQSRNGAARVLHAAELLDELIRAGQLKVENKLQITATYHDPCYLGRYNAVFRPPRRVLQALGVGLVEMPRSRAESYCCGAGGGGIWREDTPDIKERPAESRVREAAGLPGVGTLVVSCPKDLVMFQDALKTAGLEGKLVVKDLMELAEMAACPAKEPMI